MIYKDILEVLWPYFIVNAATLLTNRCKTVYNLMV